MPSGAVSSLPRQKAHVKPREPDIETIAVIRAHWYARHQAQLTDEEIILARKGRVAEATKVILTPETLQSPAWFTCLACPEGARRYRTDVGADPLRPPPRHVAAIQRHFREAHEVEDLPAGRIYHDPSVPALAVYVPSTPLRGAHVICARCPEGNNHVLIEDPPYGDACSFGRLLTLTAGLIDQVGGLDPVARSERLEAHHRGIIPQVGHSGIQRALKAARRGPPVHEPTALERGLLALTGAKAATGMGITRAIGELVALMETDTVAYACQLAGVIPGMAAHRSLLPQELAKLTRVRYGPLERTERTLWAIWDRRPGDPPSAATEPDSRLADDVVRCVVFHVAGGDGVGAAAVKDAAAIACGTVAVDAHRVVARDGASVNVDAAAIDNSERAPEANQDRSPLHAGPFDPRDPGVAPALVGA